MDLAEYVVFFLIQIRMDLKYCSSARLDILGFYFKQISHKPKYPSEDIPLLNLVRLGD